MVGGIERELTVELRPRDLQAAGVERRAGGAGAAGAEPRGAGRPAQRRARRAHDPPARPAREPADFAQLAVAERRAGSIRLGDVADVRDGTEEPRTAAVFNGEEAVGIDIKKAKGYSTDAGRRGDSRPGRRAAGDAAGRA